MIYMSVDGKHTAGWAVTVKLFCFEWQTFNL